MNDLVVGAGVYLSAMFDVRGIGLLTIASAMIVVFRHWHSLEKEAALAKVGIAAVAGASFGVALNFFGKLLRFTDPEMCRQFSTNELAGMLSFPVIVGFATAVIAIRKAFRTDPAGPPVPAQSTPQPQGSPPQPSSS